MDGWKRREGDYGVGMNGAVGVDIEINRGWSMTWRTKR
jgi:hypothetical protein